MATIEPEHPVHLVASSATTDQAVSDPDVAEDAGGELPDPTHHERLHAGFLVAVGIVWIAAIARTDEADLAGLGSSRSCPWRRSPPSARCSSASLGRCS